jgi:xylulokinase
LHTFCHAVHGKWHMMGVNLSAGDSLKWFVDRLGAEVGAAKGSADPYTILTGEAAKIAPGCEGLLFLPYLSGERTPHADPDARGAWVGLTQKHTRGHVVRAILEGVTFALRDSLAIIKELDVPVREIRATGGGAKSALWRQMQADVFGHDVVTINTEQGAAFGVGLLAAVGAGAFKNVEEACTATIQVASRTVTDRKAKALYDRAFPVYQSLYRSLKADFKTIARKIG